jgi:RNA polymerase sigma factor (sigma-70 family)
MTDAIQSDAILLAQYADSRSQQAFAELVSRHADWVYSAALRQVRDSHLAQDVTQAVFLLLSQRASQLAGKSLNGWLFRAMRYASANALRAKSRREKHERQAAAMNSEMTGINSESVWSQIAPSLDEMVAKLRPRDREAVLLRFYQSKSVAEVGEALHITQGAASKRIERAIENLRRVMRGFGIAVPSLVLIDLLLARTTHAAPASLAASCASGHASASVISISQGTKSAMIAARSLIAALRLLFVIAIPAALGTALLAAGAAPADPPPVVATSRNAAASTQVSEAIPDEIRVALEENRQSYDRVKDIAYDYSNSGEDRDNTVTGGRVASEETGSAMQIASAGCENFDKKHKTTQIDGKTIEGTERSYVGMDSCGYWFPGNNFALEYLFAGPNAIPSSAESCRTIHPERFAFDISQAPRRTDW